MWLHVHKLCGPLICRCVADQVEGGQPSLPAAGHKDQHGLQWGVNLHHGRVSGCIGVQRCWCLFVTFSVAIRASQSGSALSDVSPMAMVLGWIGNLLYETEQ